MGRGCHLAKCKQFTQEVGLPHTPMAGEDVPLNIRQLLADESYEGKMLMGGLVPYKHQKLIDKLKRAPRVKLDAYCKAHNHHVAWNTYPSSLMRERKEDLIEMMVMYIFTLPDSKKVIANLKKEVLS